MELNEKKHSRTRYFGRRNRARERGGSAGAESEEDARQSGDERPTTWLGQFAKRVPWHPSSLLSLTFEQRARPCQLPPPRANRLTSLPCIVLLPLLPALALARDPLEPYIATPARYSFRAPARNTINRTGARHPRSQTPRGREFISLQPRHVHVVGRSSSCTRRNYSTRCSTCPYVVRFEEFELTCVVREVRL